MVDYIRERKWKKFVLMTLLLATLHTSVIVLLVIPFVLKIDLKLVYALGAIALMVGGVMTVPAVGALLGRLPIVGTQVSAYIESSINFIALAERIISFLIIWYLFQAKYNENSTKKMLVFMKIYSFGLVLYFGTMAFPLIASRMMVYFKVFEILLLANLLSTRTLERPIIVFAIIAITFVMFFKNIDSYILQGDYFPNIGVFDYPYISIFNKEEIWEYRDMSMYYPYIVD
jgi:hypothetical protein